MEYVNIRRAMGDADQVRDFADRKFGFKPWMVVPLEACAGNPEAYCMFEVCGIQYRCTDGELEIHPGM